MKERLPCVSNGCSSPSFCLEFNFLIIFKDFKKQNILIDQVEFPDLVVILLIIILSNTTKLVHA